MSLDSRTTFRLFAFGLVAPLWLVDFLPMVDLPQHLAQVVAARELLSGNPDFTSLMEINWFTPYLLSYALLFLLSTLVSLPVAAQLLVSISILATAEICSRILDEVDADPRLRLLVLPGMISFGFYWGLLSFLTAIPVGLYLVLLTVRYAQRSSLARAFGIGVVSLGIFFSHFMVLVAVSLLCLAYLAASYYRAPLKMLLLWIPFTAPIPLLLVWAFTTYRHEALVQTSRVIYQPMPVRVSNLLGQATGLDVSLAVVGLLGVVMYATPRLIGSVPSKRPERYVLFGTALLMFLFVPSLAFGTAFLAERLGIFLMPFWLLLWDRPLVSNIPRSRLRLLPLVPLVILIALNLFRMPTLTAEAKDFEMVTSRVESGSRVLSVISDTKSDYFTAPIYLHQASWIQVTNKAIVEFSFSSFYPEPVRFRSDIDPTVPEQFQFVAFSQPWPFVESGNYQYIAMRTTDESASSTDLLGPFAPQRTEVARQGNWRLFEIHPTPSGP